MYTLVVLHHASRNGQDVGVEDDVVRVEPGPVHKQPERAHTYLQLPILIRSLWCTREEWCVGCVSMA